MGRQVTVLGRYVDASLTFGAAQPCSQWCSFAMAGDRSTACCPSASWPGVSNGPAPGAWQSLHQGTTMASSHQCSPDLPMPPCQPGSAQHLSPDTGAQCCQVSKGKDSSFQSNPVVERNRVGKYCGTLQNILKALRLLKAELKPYSYCVSWLLISPVTLVACERKQSSGIDCTAALSSLGLTLLCSLLPSPQLSQPLLCLSTDAAGTASGSGLWVPTSVPAPPGALSTAPIMLPLEVSLGRNGLLATGRT